MARKDIRMEELIEVLYQWHKGRNITQFKRSPGLALEYAIRQTPTFVPCSLRSCHNVSVPAVSGFLLWVARISASSLPSSRKTF